MLKEIYATIKEETGNKKHKSLSMFVFVIMSHGIRGDIVLDRDCKPVEMIKIRDLLSPHEFSAMRGKPKLIVIQACSGG